MNKRKKVNESVARPTRTAIQGTPAYLVTWLIDSALWDMNNQQFGVVVLLLTMLGSFVQTTIENSQGKGLLRQVPPKTAPVVDQ